MNRIILPTLLLAVALMFSASSVRADDATKTESKDTKAKTEQTEKKANTATKKAENAKPAAAHETTTPAAKPEAASPLHPHVEIDTTMGNIVLALDAEKAPISTLNFIQYAKDGFYNGTIFHRVMKKFMIQGGGYTIDMELKKEGLRRGIKNEWRNGLKNVRGTIAMARLPRQPDSATAQFFINVANNSFLDDPRDGAGYAVFGHVVQGMDVVDAIQNTRVSTNPKFPAPVVPVIPVVIKSVKVLSKVDMAALKAIAAKAEGKTASNQAQQEADVKKAVESAMKTTVAKLEKETGHPFVTTPSGLMYSIIKEGTGPSPQPTDTVQVNYEGSLLNGRVFDSSYKRGKPISFPLNRVIKGWTEGVSMMKVGGSRYFIIPPDLAYGARPPAGSGIPPDSTLVFKVELLAIQ